jgi:hypothetical protein
MLCLAVPRLLLEVHLTISSYNLADYILRTKSHWVAPWKQKNKIFKYDRKDGHTLANLDIFVPVRGIAFR